jgi:hypothetical protein
MDALTITSTVRVTAEGKRLTVAELREFLAAVERAGVSADATVKVRTTMSGHVRQVEIG